MNESSYFLEKLLSIPSPSGQEDTAGQFLVQQMAALGFRAHRDEAGNAVGIVGNSDARREIVLLGHIDTVPGDIPVRRQGNLLYGRGAVDAKGPLAAFVLAAARVAPELSDTKIVVIGAVGEEAHSPGAHYLKEAMPAPTCAIIGEPSNWDAITLGYKGSMRVKYRWTQPTSHSASERPGPAEKAVDFWNRLVGYAKAENAGRTSHFDMLIPALCKFRTFSDGLNDGVETKIGIRLPPGFDPDTLQQKMLLWSDGAELTFPTLEMPFQADKNASPARALRRAIRAEGGRPRPKLKSGTSDMNVVGAVWDCPMVAYGPGDSSLDHTPDEHIDVQEFERAINVLARALEILSNTKESREVV